MIANLKDLVNKAKERNTKILAIAVAEDNYVMQAIAKAKKLGLIAPIFVGNSNKIKTVASEEGVIIEDSEIINVNSDIEACRQAVKLVKDGRAKLLMKGLVSTNTLLKQVISKDDGLLTGHLLSHLAIFESPYYHKLLGITDAAMNISPTIDEKISILQNAVSAFKSLGYPLPKAALLAAVEKINPKMVATTDADKIKQLAQAGIIMDCLAEGPLALDNAVSKVAANHKGIRNEVAGDADILLVPDINSGNVLYKALSFLGNAKCAAVIVGSKAPIVLTSRADSEETKFLSIALGVLLSK